MPRELALPSQLRKTLLGYTLVTVPALLLLGTLSGRLSNSGYGNPWFDALTKPAIMPPGWAFGIAWTILYALQGVAVALVLNARGAPHRTRALTFFALQFAVNLAWSPIFFAWHQPRLALLVICLMFGLAIATTVLFFQVRRSASGLMLPYLAWLAFAAVLNYQLVALNPNAENLAAAPPAAQIILAD